MFQKTNVTYPLILIPALAYQGVRNIGLSENFAHLMYDPVR